MPLKLSVESLEGLDEPLKALYAKQADGKFRLSVDGLEDTSGLKNALSSERSAREALEKKLKEYDGIDVTEVHEMLKHFQSNEEAKLVKEGKIDAVIEKRMEKLRLDLERKLKAAEDAAKAAGDRASRWTQRVLDNHVREAAMKAQLHPNAIDDALFRARQSFKLNDEGAAVQEKDGAVVLGKDGKTPYSVSEWLDTMRESAPHWWPASGNGGGAAAGQSGGGGGKKTMTRTAFDQLDPASRAAAMKEGTAIID